MYQLIFEVPAVLRVVVDVEADDSETAIVGGHEAVMRFAAAAKALAPGQALQMPQGAALAALEWEGARFTDSYRADVLPETGHRTGDLGDHAPTAPGHAEPPMKAPRKDDFVVEFFENRNFEGPPRRMTFDALDAARQCMQQVMDQDGVTPYALARVLCKSSGTTVASFTARRGRFEVREADAYGTGSVLYTWLDSKLEASRLAAEVSIQRGIAVEILDSNDRRRGPFVLRTIK